MMLKKIVVAPDSFKGSLSACEVAGCCTNAISEVNPVCEVVSLPLADGGEGTVDALAESFGGRIIEIEVSGPLGYPVLARYALSGDGREAVMEMAQAAGLYLIDEKDRNPLLTSSFGVGEMIKDAAKRGCRKIYMGIGGSATNDGGMGMLNALGFRFIDKDGNNLYGRGEDLEKLKEIQLEDPDFNLRDVEFVVACDVDNPFIGERGAAYVFAPQKGADPDMVERLDKGMKNFADVVEDQLDVEFRNIPGSGAAGGLGGALYAFLGAKLQSGIDMVLDAIDFDEKIKGADLIISGEGSVDRQSLMGKVPSGVLKRAKVQNLPVVVIAGQVKDSKELNEAGFAAVFPIAAGPVSLQTAMTRSYAAENVYRTIKQVISLFFYR